ncbi:hypothetical protein ACFSCW_03455 [Sphingomonas tabacisoli]|uniref:FHA domain-containing protein n=1 Tax=Sphingomonas tabacisoli TaxID=2249466 RepID=A0ABW4HZ31_9SPHN
MPYVPARRDTLLIPSGPDGDHLFVITTDACLSGRHLLVNFTKAKPGRHVDDACLLAPGDHPFVTADSYVLYRSARLEPANRLTLLVDGWVYKVGRQATEELTQRILNGFGESRFTPKFVKDYLAKWPNP